jgi:glycerol-3-phosphate dehydrogenase (NAD(P)+)
MKRAAVIGAGSFGTALAVHAARAGFDVALWARRPEAAAELAAERCNRRYLGEVELPAGVHPTADLAAVAGSDVVVMAAPSHGYREVLRALLGHWPRDRELLLVSSTKGIETETLARMSQVSAEEAEKVGQPLRFGVLSGPSFAAELANGVPTAAVIASADEALSLTLQSLLSSRTLRLYTSADVVGVELGGAARTSSPLPRGSCRGSASGTTPCRP